MPFDRPTLPELIDQGATEFESRLPGVLVRLRRSVVGVINRVLAGGLSALYQYAEWLNRQAWPDLAEAEYLDGHGARWGVTRTAAAKATGNVTLTGTAGAVAPAGMQLQRADGTLYATVADVALASNGSAAAAVQAVVAGQAGNALQGVALTATSPVAGINSAAAASTALAGGADVERDEPYRGRILARIRKPPQGGADYDYVSWAKEVPGVTRAWLYPGEQGPGSVVVRFVRDDDSASIFPDAGEVAAVQARIDLQRPVTAQAYALAPINTPLQVLVAISPDTPAVRAAVVAELQAMIVRDAEPGATILRTHVAEAISIAAGERNHQLMQPAADVAHSTGRMASLGTVTFTAWTT